MQPNEKAKELLSKMAWVCRDNGNYPEVARQCALIAIDEIKSGLSDYGEEIFKFLNIDEELKFWDDVRSDVKILEPEKQPIICPCCGSNKTYRTDAIHCTICAVTTEI